ncbi:autotransporter outer membrane beta-barrel domain-containing protein [Photobacterium sp. SDRW27]|uniref:autotransporter outer membrane beta-barrel domain-containing protein n=1 Tax=Photobacterium obscurum TaxID=2829490 RepID=UPI00224320A8|nr:autotransporter outer membrane beta-barrel domain-containing protein [Photobacterium obscurum]MCW8329295.1 autotransporter outer membrane beta-barrel domain-containing protein [Photobacterium obscurum]
MDISTRLIIRGAPIMMISLTLCYQSAYAASPDGSGSMVSRVSEEVYAAISDLWIASDIRGDKLSKDELGVSVYRGHNSNDMAARANDLRYAAKQNALPSSYGNQFSELTLFQNGGLGEQNYSRLGAYVRFEPINVINENVSFINERSIDNNEGYSVTLGGDYLLNDHYLFGLALGLPFGETDDDNTKSEIDGLVASGYFSYFQDDWYVDFTASYALMDTDIERRITHYSDSVINNSSEADSDIWVFSLGGGYVVNYNYLNIAFESSVQYTLSDTERYAEKPSKGNSNYLISKVDNINNLESTMVIAGVSLSHPLRSSIGIFQPYVRGYVHYDIDSGSERIISQLKADNSGSVLPIIVDTDDSIYGRMHLGISGAFNQDWNGYAEASTLFGLDDLSAYTFTVGLSVSLD